MLGEVPTRPVVRYHGGKWLLAPWIISHFPEHRKYVEPFGGGGNVLLQKPRSEHEVYNDLDDGIVNLFRVLRDPELTKRLRDLLDVTPYARNEFYDSYIPSEDPVESARKTLVRAWMSISSVGVCRKSRTGFAIDDVAVKRYQGIPDGIKAVSNRMLGVLIEHRPALQVVEYHDAPDTLHYCDPPYVPETRSSMGGGVYQHEMTVDDHRQLADVLRALKGMVILSGYPCDLYDKDLFADWHRVERQHLADKAQERTEVLWINEAAASRLEKQVTQEGLF
jgi:DNA adenine methylase